MNNYSISSLLNKQEIKTIINVFEKEGIEIRLVGGCVRDGILKRESKDIDCSVNSPPEKIIKTLKKNNFQYDDFAKKYGSIITFVNSQKFEITSLRRDINQKGRHTDIIYTDNWELDAERRDFTVNAIYLKGDGNFVDYFGGLKDLEENKIKFIGDIEKRVKEDFLRIFRYYRFLGIFEKPQIIDNYELMLHRYCNDAFNNLSNDIIRMEILKMFNNPFALNSFCNQLNPQEKNYWLKLTTKYFLDNNYKLGLEKCLNIIDFFFKRHQDNND